MKTIFKILAFVGLGLTIIPSILYFSDAVTLDRVKVFMLLGTLLWLGTSPFAARKASSQQ